MNDHDVWTAEDVPAGLSLLANASADVVVVDSEAGGEADIVEGFSAASPGVEVVLLTTNAPAADDDHAFQRIERASATPEAVRRVVRRACERKHLVERVRRLERKLETQDRAGEIVGASRTMDEVFDLAHGAAAASAPLLLVGETGTGKEMLARAIHRQGRRAGGPFVVVDCAALPADRIEAELFGTPHGGTVPRPLLAAADGGTLFLADIAYLPSSAQARLVQAMQRGEVTVEPDGPPRQVDTRIIAATCVELKPLVDDGRVRRDLYFHLYALVIRVPPLRRRKDDIPLLAYHFLHRYAQRVGRSMQRISPEALRLLREHRWTGNVRELEHAMERAAVLSRTEVVLPADLAFLRGEQASSFVVTPTEGSGQTAFDTALFDLTFPEAKKQAVAAFERAYVQEVLRRTGDNVSEAARQAGLDRSNFRRMMKKTLP